MASRVRATFLSLHVAVAVAAVGAVVFAPRLEWRSAFVDTVTVWLAIVAALLLLQAVIGVPAVQRFLYYRIWLGLVLRVVLRAVGGVAGDTPSAVRVGRHRLRWLLKPFDMPYEGWIPDSAGWRPPGGLAPCAEPVFVQRDHLGTAWRWPGKAFAQIVMVRELDLARDAEGRTRLTVDIGNSAYGIYKNRGKQFLQERMARLHYGRPLPALLDDAARAHRYFLGDEPLPPSLGGPEMPLRWSSAGALPIVSWRKPGDAARDDWFVLVFHEIEPVGWNPFLGASETRDEWRKPFEAAVRELCEELVIITERPVRDGKPVPHVRQRRFLLDQVALAHPRLVRRLTDSELFHQHNEFRKGHDGIEIRDAPGPGPQLHAAATDFTVRVDDGRQIETHHSLIIVNPLEAGIECVFVFKFALADDDHLLFGEVLDDLAVPARSPVMLLRRSYVEQAILRNGRFGDPLPDLERRRMPQPPPDAFHLFDADLELRRLRYADLMKKASRSPSEEAEVAFHEGWFQAYGTQFDALRDGRPVTVPNAGPHTALDLCAATWKTLELVVRYGIGKDQPPRPASPPSSSPAPSARRGGRGLLSRLRG